jgi:hypothetical protein
MSEWGFDAASWVFQLLRHRDRTEQRPMEALLGTVTCEAATCVGHGRPPRLSSCHILGCSYRSTSQLCVATPTALRFSRNMSCTYPSNSKENTYSNTVCTWVKCLVCSGAPMPRAGAVRWRVMVTNAPTAHTSDAWTRHCRRYPEDENWFCPSGGVPMHGAPCTRKEQHCGLMHRAQEQHYCGLMH